MSFDSPQFSKYVRDFSRGFLDAPESDTLPLNASPDARNLFLASVMEARDAGGAGARAVLRKRKQAAMLNPVAMTPGASVDLVFWYQPETAAPKLLAVCNGSLYVFDDIDTFTLVGACGFTPGRVVDAFAFKDNVWMTDGLVQKRFNGTALFDVGFIAPTAAPGLAIVAGGTLPVGATYESFAVWWDSTMDHESSPSATAAAVTTTAGNLTRRHTKPAGAPPSNVNFWRVYVRRVDTNELNFYRAGTVAIATATLDESVIDGARTILGPKPSSNDQPPVFATMAIQNGYLIGIKTMESYYYVSKVDDPESVNPTDKFAIERGSGKSLKSVTRYATDILLQKPDRSWRLVGERTPFKAELVHSEFGNVGPNSAIEVESLFYAWDEQKGPYRTDLVEWEPLAANRIGPFLSTLDRDAQTQIQVEHDPENHLVVWAVPVTSPAQPRRRCLLPYNYRLNCWLPPITGLEYSTLCRYQPIGASLGLYTGDYWGRVYKLFQNDREGVPAGAPVTATVVSATTSTVTCAPATPFYTTGTGMAGLLVLAQSPSGAFQWRRIESNTVDTITLDTTHDSPWTTVPAAGWTIHLGATETYWTTPWVDFARPELLKRGLFLFIEGRSAPGNTIVVHARFDQDTSNFTTYGFQFPQQGMVWGVGIWGQGLWGLRTRVAKKIRINRAFHSMQLRVEGFFADTVMDVTAYGIEADGRRRKRAA